MRLLTNIVLMVLFALFLFGQANGVYSAEPPAKVDEQPQLEADFIPDKSEIIFGEPLFITFTVTNRHYKPYRFFVGGDNRGSVRHNNFHIAAMGIDGHSVKDPYSYNHFGGHGQNIVLESEQTYTERLYLGHWCAFEKPGVYTITCKRTLTDYGDEPRFPSVPVITSFKLKIVPFDQEKMRKIIANWGNKIRFGDEQALREASLALSEIKDEAVIPHLAESLRKGDWQNKNPAIDGLSRYSTDASADALITAVKDNDHVVRDQAAKGLSAIKRKDYAADLLLAELSDVQAPVRALAAKALGHLRSKRVFESLIAALNDKDAKVRYSAAEALGTLGDPRGIEPLNHCVKDDDFGLRLVATKGLVILKQPIRAEWLTAIIKATTDLNDQKFHEAIRILRLYGGEQAAPALISCLQFDDPSPRNTYNMFLILAIEHSPGGPKYYYKYHHDPNIDGSAEQIEENRKILDELKAWRLGQQEGY